MAGKVDIIRFDVKEKVDSKEWEGISQCYTSTWSSDTIDSRKSLCTDTR